MPTTTLHAQSHELSRLLHLGYEAGLEASGWRTFVHAAAETFETRLAILFFVDHDDPTRSFWVTGGVDAEFDEQFSDHWTHDSQRDAYWQGICHQPPGTVRLAWEILSPAARRRNHLHRKLARPWDLEHFLMGVVANGPGATAVLTFGRSHAQPPFALSDKGPMQALLLAHLRRSLALHRDVSAMRSTNSLLTAAIDHAPYGLVIFDGHGMPLLINRKSTEIFTAADGLDLREGVLRAFDDHTQSLLDWSLGAAIRISLGGLTGPPAPVLVKRKTNDLPYKVTFAPLSPRNETVQLPTGSACCAIIEEASRGRSMAMAPAFVASYKLTRAETRLCEALLDGQSLSQAAAALDVSRNTAKTHLARIFDKTGVRSQAALLRFLALGARERARVTDS